MLVFGLHNEAMFLSCTILSSAWLILFASNMNAFYYLLGVIFFGLAEWTLASKGIWVYTNPEALGFPFWMPFMWGLCISILKQTTDTLKEL